MSTAIKRTTAGIITVFFMLMVTAGFAFATPSTNNAPLTNAKTNTTGIGHKYAELMNVSDIIFYAPEPTKIEFTETSEEIVPEEPEVTSEEDYGYYDYEYYQEYTNPTYTGDYTSGPANRSGIYIPAGTTVEAADFAYNGSYYDDNWSYTYYPERVLPGGGLDIPGRHTDADGYICDGDGNICVASDDLPQGTIVPLPFEDSNGDSRTGVVYDTGSGYGNLDIYTSW